MVGAIDGTHVEIIKPKGESAVDYFSRKQKYAIVNQAISDGNLFFLVLMLVFTMLACLNIHGYIILQPWKEKY